MANNVSLPEFVSHVQGTEGKPVIRFNEKEIRPDGMAIGDEDSTTGASQNLIVQLELETSAGPVVYENVYDNQVEYEEDMKIIKGLLEETGN
ncbi:hypothetical protein DRW41_10060 [Neobacillus piezotolerans]|uniref:Uncharacterized protein n=1 Tax=Neobacillus piezotolerans TaxID=2259171 RepID=A0A3D8GSG9_9BACI|nr:hypothetical protein [Neobacillus piezotolerans]RDU37026.1 hypothetical protein DRW41_10060 [Neobacillus piezotolerans]